MKLRIVALGHRMPAWVADGISDYHRRLSRDWPLEIVELKPEKRSASKTTEQLLAAEASRIKPFWSNSWLRIALDENGTSWTTRQLADRLGQWHSSGSKAAFLLGSADGIDANLRAEADFRWSLSALTLPHGLARVLVVEQLFRAVCIRQGHPYHRN